MAEHWDADVTCYMTGERELVVVELGERVEVELGDSILVGLYRPADRVRVMVGCMVGQVAAVTSQRGEPFPLRWWPPSAGLPPAELLAAGVASRG